MNYQEEFKQAKKYLLLGDYDSVKNIIDLLKSRNDEDPQLLYDVALLYAAMGEYGISLKEIKKSFDIEKSVEKLELLAELNYELCNYTDSAIQYEELTKHKDNLMFYEKSITSYIKLEMDEEAIQVAKMLVEKHKDPHAYAKLTFLYISAGMAKEAIESCKEMDKLFHNNSATYNMMGFLYESIYNDYDKAKFYFKKSAKCGDFEAYYNLGVCCKHTEDYKNAEKYLKKTVALKPDTMMDYNYTLGSVYFAQRKLGLGYKYYKKRGNCEKINYANRFKIWDGKSYPNETLYVLTEQGYGDNIQFVRYLPFVADKFKKVYHATRDNLIDLFKHSFPKELYPNIEFIRMEDSVRFNKFAYIMDLPYIMHQTFHNIPSKESYLIADKRKAEMNKTNFFNNDECKIGLCWKAMGMGIRDAVYRTIDAPYYFKDIMNLPDVRYYSFQKNDIFDMCQKYPQIKDLSPMLNTFDDTASMMTNLDIMITVDTAVAHLAGALGIKTYLLLCYAPDWRWFDNNKKTEWYPSITIIKQQDRRSWEDVAATLTKYIKADIKKFSSKK